jgi:hypothetical protein
VRAIADEDESVVDPFLVGEPCKPRAPERPAVDAVGEERGDDWRERR